jgi:transposase
MFSEITTSWGSSSEVNTPNPKKLAAYSGLNPKVHQSGINQKSGRLAHNGRNDARHFLVQGAQSGPETRPENNPFS